MMTFGRIESKHFKISRESSRPYAPLEPPVGEVVEKGDSVRNHEGVVVGHAGYASAQNYVFSHSNGFCNKKIRCRYVFPLGSEVLTDPCFSVTKLIKEY